MQAGYHGAVSQQSGERGAGGFDPELFVAWSSMDMVLNKYGLFSGYLAYMGLQYNQEGHSPLLSTRVICCNWGCRETACWSSHFGAVESGLKAELG